MNTKIVTLFCLTITIGLCFSHKYRYYRQRGAHNFRRIPFYSDNTYQRYFPITTQKVRRNVFNSQVYGVTLRPSDIKNRNNIHVMLQPFSQPKPQKPPACRISLSKGPCNIALPR